MLSDEQKENIIRLRESGKAWYKVAAAVGAKIGALKYYYGKWRLDKDLPPKEKSSRSIISASCGLKLKALMR